MSQGVGTYRRDLILEYGRNVDGIKRTIDKTDLYNEITPTGKDGLNITSLEKEEYDENGNLEFYTKSGSQNIFAPQSKARYRAQLLNDTDGWLRRYYSADGTSNVNTLYSLALNELKKHAYPAITYEVTGFYDLDIGDTVRIVDHSFTPTLIIQARVAEQSICFSDPTKNKTTFGNILALESRVSQDLTGRLKELVDQVTPYRFEIVSDNGLTFKNNEGNTTLTARVYKGSNIDEVSVDSFEWLLNGVKFGGTSKSQLINASQVSGTAVVRYNAKIGDTVIGGIEVTLQDVSDGTITHTAYSNSAEGTDGFTTVYPNLNLLDGTKDFSGEWDRESWGWENDGSYKGLTVKKRHAQWGGINKIFTAPKDGTYTFSAYVKSSGNTANIQRYTEKNGTGYWDGGAHKELGNNFDWLRDSFTVTLKANDTITARYEISGSTSDLILWTAGHKWEEGSTATPYMQSASEVTTADWPKYRGEYSDISSEQSTNPSNYTWTIVRGNDGTDGVSPTVTVNPDTSLTIVDAKGTIKTPVLKGSDGLPGKDGVGIKNTVITYAISTSGTTVPTTGWTSSVPSLVKGQYLWTKTVWTYTDNSSETGYSVSYISKDGTDGDDGLPGKDGTGIKTTTITYAGSTSGTTAPTSGWTSTVPTVAAGSYLWTKTVWAYTDNTSETGYSVAMMGPKGDKGDPGIKGSDGTSGIIVSSVAPDNPQTGQLWQDTSTTPQLVKKWTGSEWVIWEFYAQNLKADSLETVSAKIGKIYNEFEYEDTGNLDKGSITIDNDIQIITESTTNVNHPKTDIALSTNSNFTGLQVRYFPNNNISGGHQTAYYTYKSINMQDSINGWSGQISAEALHNKGWKNVTGFINGVQADAVPLQYKVTINMDSTRTIKFRGGFKGNGTSDLPQAGIVQLPVEARPTTTIAFPCMGSGARLARIIISADGWIQFNVAVGSSISGFNAVLLSNVFYEI